VGRAVRGLFVTGTDTGVGKTVLSAEKHVGPGSQQFLNACKPRLFPTNRNLQIVAVGRHYGLSIDRDVRAGRPAEQGWLGGDGQDREG
jgi:hypothetical protein